MLRLLAVLVSLAVVLVVAFRVAQADPPNRRVIDEIQELRQQVGPAGQVVGDQREFAQALEDVAERDRGAYREPTEGFDRSGQNELRVHPSDDNYGQGTLQWSEEPGLSPRTNQAWIQPPAANPVQPASGYDSRWEGPRPRPAYGRPQPPGPPRGPKPPQPPQERSPQELLRTSAFELDRLAHELEMAELFGEADALREAAGTLRKAARKGNELVSDPGPTERERDRPKPRRRERLKLRDRDGRLPGIDRPELPKRNLDLLAPPKGVHGGPKDPALNEAIQQLERLQPSQPVEAPSATDE